VASIRLRCKHFARRYAGAEPAKNGYMTVKNRQERNDRRRQAAKAAAKRFQTGFQAGVDERFATAAAEPQRRRWWDASVHADRAVAL
jgi:hypothetical protein